MKTFDVLRRKTFLHDQAAQILGAEAKHKIEHHAREAKRLRVEAALLEKSENELQAEP